LPPSPIPRSERINEHNIQNIDQLLPWNWKTLSARLAA
jgi:hypothetical protein